MIQLPKGKIAIEPIFDPDVTKGGIWVPDQAKERCDQGIIAYIAPDEKDFEVGDYVLFSGYEGTLVQLEGEGLLIIMKVEGVVAKIAPPDYLNTVINGLFFSTYEPVGTLAEKIVVLVEAESYDKPSEQERAGLVELIKKEIVKWELKKYFPANYEQAKHLVSEEFTRVGYPNRFRFKERKEARAKKHGEHV